MANYLYEPIDSHQREIRLLTIHSIKDHGFQKADHVKCSLSVVSLNETPEYHALSYTWGDPNLPRSKILLDDVTVEVTPSLEAAVRTFRRNTEPVRFWIDAICINQEDPEEKAHQIKLMTDIYSHATVVDIYLGSGTAETDKAMEASRRLGTAAFDLGILSLSVESLRGGVGNDWYADLHHPSDDDHLAEVKRSVYHLSQKISNDFPYTAWINILAREYWNRLWVMQEFCLGKNLTITCGRTSVPYYQCFEAALIFLEIHVYIFAKSQNLTDATQIIGRAPSPIQLLSQSLSANKAWSDLVGARNRQQRVKGSPERLLELLQRCCIAETKVAARQARYPRDLVYGLLGIAADAAILDIIPVYTNIESSRETAEIYTSVTRKLLHQGHVDILAWCQQPKGLVELPTWVPDFTHILPTCSESKTEGLFSTSGGSSLALNTKRGNLHQRLIEVGGVKVDAVSHLGSSWSPEHTIQLQQKSTETILKENSSRIQFFDDVTAFCEQARATSKTGSPSDDEKWPEAHWRIPCADQAYNGVDRSRATGASMQGYNDIRRNAELYKEIEKRTRELSLPPEEFAQKFKQYMETFGPAYSSYHTAMQYQSNRRPFISTNGYVGLVPAHTKPLDLVIIIFGAIQPFVVREAEHERFELIGEAYVHGIMDGEFLETQPEVRDFVLC